MMGKPIYITKELIINALLKPEKDVSTDILRKNHPRKGRTAYRLDVYKEKTSKKIIELKEYMAKIDKQSTEWKRVRKQLLALIDRVNKRVKLQTT